MKAIKFKKGVHHVLYLEVKLRGIDPYSIWSPLVNSTGDTAKEKGSGLLYSLYSLHTRWHTWKLSIFSNTCYRVVIVMGIYVIETNIKAQEKDSYRQVLTKDYEFE